ncbi:hypothetical protein TNCV_215481 [Trichonephila clavipes]|nr:hypothetical protein TNCV_215481 [Trichonephila clavipes]
MDRQNSRFRTAKATIIKFGLHASFVELESAKRTLNEALLEGINALKSGQEDMQKSQEETKKGLDDTKNELNERMEKG